MTYSSSLAMRRYPVQPRDSRNSRSNWWLIGNKIAERIAKVSKNLSNNNSETNEKEILRETFLPPELRHNTINDLRFNEENYLLFKIIIII